MTTYSSRIRVLHHEIASYLIRYDEFNDVKIYT
jgi:hypothetical protein